MHANPGFVSGVYLYLSTCPSPGASRQGRASEKGSCQGPVSLDKSEVSILHRQHGILVVWGAGGALEESPGPQAIKFSVIRTGPSVWSSCDLYGPGDDSEMILVSSTGPGLMTEMIDLAR